MSGKRLFLSTVAWIPQTDGCVPTSTGKCLTPRTERNDVNYTCFMIRFTVLLPSPVYAHWCRSLYRFPWNLGLRSLKNSSDGA